MRRSPRSNRRKTKRPCSGWKVCKRYPPTTQQNKRMKLRCAVVLFATLIALHTAQAATVWSGLVMARNAAQPTPVPAQLDPIEGTLRGAFGYNQFEIIGEATKTLKSGEEDWLASSKYF